MCSLEKESLESNSSHSQRLYNFSLFMPISQRFISPVSFDGAKQNIVLFCSILLVIRTSVSGSVNHSRRITFVKL